MLLEEFDMEEFLRMDRRDERAAGRIEGKAEGRAEGKAEGECIGFAKSVVRILETKFEIPDELRSRILSERRMEVLESWVQAAVQTASLSEFEKFI